MTRNPYLNALYASLYIVTFVTILQMTEKSGSGEDSFVIPIVMLSLLVLSVATMAFLFFFEPLQLFVDGKRKEAATFFLKTLGTFAGLTSIFGIIALLMM